MGNMSRLRQSENAFVKFAIDYLSEKSQAIEGRELLNRFFEAGVSQKYSVPSRKQLLSCLRKHPEVYARLQRVAGSSNTTFYSLNPILSPIKKNDGSRCSSRRYKQPTN